MGVRVGEGRNQKVTRLFCGYNADIDHIVKIKKSPYAMLYELRFIKTKKDSKKRSVGGQVSLIE